MNNLNMQSKIKWVQLRTGCSNDEAKKFLESAGWKVQLAIDARRDYYKRLSDVKL